MMNKIPIDRVTTLHHNQYGCCEGCEGIAERLLYDYHMATLSNWRQRHTLKGCAAPNGYWKDQR